MTTRYRVVVVGMGKRGVHHAAAFAANPRFELAGIADSDQTRLDAAAAKFGSARSGTDTQKLTEEVKPDVFCFCTPPNVRLPLIELGIKSGAKLIAFEKPVAMTSAEGIAIKRALDASGVKAVVSHQHRYGDHYKKVKAIVASGAIGKVHTVYGTATGWAAHMLSHLVDYTSWFNEYEPAEWVMGQAAGRGKLDPIEPRVTGLHRRRRALPKRRPRCLRLRRRRSRRRRKCRTGGASAASVRWDPTAMPRFTPEADGARSPRDGMQSGPGSMDYEHDMAPYVQEMADWLDDEGKPHPLRFARAYQGLEIVSGLYRSVIEGGQIALPLTSGMDELAGLKSKVPDRKVLMTLAESAKEYKD